MSTAQLPPPPDDELDGVLLARYFAGECTVAERLAVERWLESEPRRRDEVAALRRLWDVAATLPTSSRVDAMWDGLVRRMHAPDVTVMPPDSPVRVGPVPKPQRVPPVFPLMPARTPWRAGWRVARAAAAAVLTVVGATLVWRATAETETSAPTASAPAMREFATARGQRATIRLLDGTRVELGFASTLRVRPFADGRRELYLEGEALFDVVHDEARPFIVHAANATTEDLGTTFGVRAYPGEDAVRVVVISGKVAMRPTAAVATDRENAAVLGPGQLGRLDARGHLRVMSDVDTSAYVDWLTGRVSFDNLRLDEIAAELERRFDVTIRVPEGAAGMRVTVDMETGTLTDVLDAVTIPLKLRHRRAGGVIVLER